MNEKNMENLAVNTQNVQAPVSEITPVTDVDDFFYEDNDIIDIPEEILEPVAPVVMPVPEKVDMKLTEQELNRMLEEESNENEEKVLDDSYVLSNFDVLFDSLYSDVSGANNFISNLIEQKKTVNINEVQLSERESKLNKDREDFDKYVEAQKASLELEKKEVNEYVKNQRIRIQNEEEKFNADCEATRAELALADQSLKNSNEKLVTEKEQFEQYRTLEEEKLNADHLKLDTEKEQFAKEKALAEEKIRNSQRELQTQKEQFAKSKELEEKKLELESKNLSQSCARFKELVSQFNSGFQQLPDQKN